MKLRLIMRTHVVDYDAKLAGYVWQTAIVEVELKRNDTDLPEIVGGEWLEGQR